MILPRASTKAKAKWRPHKQNGQMNATERRFEQQVLMPRLLCGEIVSYQYEAVRLRIGVDWKTTYTPDFFVLLATGEMELIDVKGSAGWEDHTRVKIKACAEKYPMFHWLGYSEGKGKAGKGRFTPEVFNAG